jgi:predicted unusual protein kinase regulating ubiquinone biosynthesis (AarF/ABC1/UbiB family)
VDAFSLQNRKRNHIVDTTQRVKIRVSMARVASGSSGKEGFGAGATIEPPLARAVEIAKIVAGKVMSPLISSLITGGMPSDWETFWSRPNGDLTNGQRVALALEKLGPTYVKFGQALASRPDVIPKSLANALSRLQDSMQPFDSPTAKAIIKKELSGVMEDHEIDRFLATLTDSPVAAASVGQVYKGHLDDHGPVAVKVQRPGIRPLVESDAALLRTLATWAESIPAFPSASGKHPSRLIATELVDAVEEFMSRIFEELDYRNEAANVALFASLYCQRLGSTPMCVVPEIFTKLCTDNVLIMEWVEGTKITAIGKDEEGALAENAKSLEVIRHGISCTLSQLLETGVLHADPHGGVFVTCGAVFDVAHETKIPNSHPFRGIA